MKEFANSTGTDYKPAQTVANSGVGYAANRVQKLVLKKVRMVSASGEVLEESEPLRRFKQRNTRKET